MLARRVRRRESGAQQRVITTVTFAAAALAYIVFLRPAEGLDRIRSQPFAPAKPAMSAYGVSRAVHMRFALPNEPIVFPIESSEDPSALRYAWLPLRGGHATPPQPLTSSIVAPAEPGFYRLAVLGDSAIRVFDDLPLAVLVPFSEKTGTTLNGYRIGRYRGERTTADRDPPPRGFLEIHEEDLDIRLTEHLQLADFVNHDNQDVWPRYAALDPRLLDKLELVFAVLARRGVDSTRSERGVDVAVHSGFRTPLHNRRVARAASDSRHQYGDAADIAVDANRDGRVSAADARLVASAVDRVERTHPDLIGGLGLYTTSGSPYVHVDARGTRARWRG